MRSKQDAAAARAAAAQRDEARGRLSGLEVERQGYVARGDEDGVAAVDDEIAKYKALAEDDDEVPTVEAVPVDLTGLTPGEVFQALGVPADVVDAFAAEIAQQVQAARPGDEPATGKADADQPAEPTGRRGRAKAAAQPADAPASDDTAAPAGA